MLQVRRLRLSPRHKKFINSRHGLGSLLPKFDVDYAIELETPARNAKLSAVAV